MDTEHNVFTISKPTNTPWRGMTELYWIILNKTLTYPAFAQFRRAKDYESVVIL